MSFSIGNTAVAGLMLLKNRPLTLIYWFGLALLVTGGGAALMYGTGFMKVYQQVLTQGAGETMDPQGMMAALRRMLGLMALMVPIYLLYFAAMTTAAVRAVLQPEKKAFGYLRLGAEELRTLVVLLAVTVIIVVAYVAAVFVAAVVGAAAAIGGAAAGGEVAGGLLSILLVLLIVILVIAALAWLATRMSLAIPQTFDTRRINIFGTWAITKGNTGKLFLAYLLAFLIYFAITMVGGLINLALMGQSLAALIASANSSNPSDVTAVFERSMPVMIVNLVVSGIVAALGTAVMVCPSAEAYLELANRSQRDADVFA
jgi:hypothetical protein